MFTAVSLFYINFLICYDVTGLKRRFESCIKSLNMSRYERCYIMFLKLFSMGPEVEKVC
jgi:hypothetical protein